MLRSTLEAEVDLALQDGQSFEIALEVWRVLVDQPLKILHETGYRGISGKGGHDSNEARITAGPNLSRPYTSSLETNSRH